MTVFSSIPPRYLENIHAEQSTFTVKAINLKIHLHNGSFLQRPPSTARIISSVAAGKWA